MKKSKIFNTLVEVWRYKDDETKSKNVQVVHNTTIRTLLTSSEINDAETISIYNLTKKGKLKLIYSKDDQLMKLYRVTFETAYWHMGVLPLFFHPQYEVEAKDEDEAKEKAQEAFNSHPDNVKLERKIVNVEELI